MFLYKAIKGNAQKDKIRHLYFRHIITHLDNKNGLKVKIRLSKIDFKAILKQSNINMYWQCKSLKTEK